MNPKRILGLDLGPNSIGWATILETDNSKTIESAGSRIIPMDAAKLGDFEKGNPQSQTNERTTFRGTRRLRERHLLRRERMLKVLHLLKWLPEHFEQGIDFSNNGAKFLQDKEPKIAWQPTTDGRYEFFFKEAFREMLADFARMQPALVEEGKKIPYDWTLYFLRKKALTEKIRLTELAWLLLNFNQKRGYYELRGETEEKTDKLEEFYSLKVVKVEKSDEKSKGNPWYNIHLENGWIYRRQSAQPLDWEGKVRDFIVTTDLNPDGTPKLDKEGNVKRSFRAPNEDDWNLKKKKTENEISISGKAVGEYIYDTLLQNPKQKINGSLVSTIERKFYKEELRRILETQSRFHSQLNDSFIYEECLKLLYPSNEAFRKNISGKNLIYLFIDNILFYQRPLKSKKSLIANCEFESYSFVKDGKTLTVPIKCIAKSNPLYQEFRLWQFLSNLRILQRTKEVDGKLSVDVDVTGEFLPDNEAWANLFDILNDRKEIDQKTLLTAVGINKKKQAEYRWNYVEDKKYPCNETRHLLLSRWNKAGLDKAMLTQKLTMELWHILYSVEAKDESKKALSTFAHKNGLPENEFVEAFLSAAAFKKDYGAYSRKAIKRLLPLLRRGKYWSAENIDTKTKTRIENIIDGVADDSINERTREKLTAFSDISQFQGLPVWLASYVTFNRHSESDEQTKWNSPDDIDTFLKNFRQHSLRNPIVEQVVTETLRTVRDIWRKYGQIDEIHIEMGRDIKQTAEERKRRSAIIQKNENTNIRIKMLLSEFFNEGNDVENVRPMSPIQQDKLRIYEGGVLNSVDGIQDNIEAILKKFNESDPKKQPTKAEIRTYRQWLEQNYVSPYTGQPIPLSKLFSPDYQIEHIIPQSLYFDDSFSNKIICEAEVNKRKSNMLAYNFIKECGGEVIQLGNGKSVRILKVEEYEQLVKRVFASNRKKQQNLLATDIPDDFSQRQLTDTRYISRFLLALLSNIVREKDEKGQYESTFTSKNVIPCNGSITDRLKKDWGVGDVWNRIIAPRFARLNGIYGDNRFGDWTNVDGKKFFRTQIPLELQRSVNKKRIDHRHHAMDAIVIACTSRQMVNYLNNSNAHDHDKRIDLRNAVCSKAKTDTDGNYRYLVKKPWPTFTEDMAYTLSQMLVSIKQNLRIVNRCSNRYQRYENGKKVTVRQTKGEMLAIRKPLHKDSVFGQVNLRSVKTVSLNVALENPLRIVDKQLKTLVRQLAAQQMSVKQIADYVKKQTDFDVKKVDIYIFSNETNTPLVAIRKPVDTSLTKEKILKSVTDTGIQKILLRHLEANDNKPELAFSPEGIEEMNKNIVQLNNGRFHQPIYKVRIYETKGLKFNIGTTGTKATKFVEAAQGTNLFFAVYLDSDGKRNYESVPLNIVVERLKQGMSPVPETNENGDRLLFHLSPNDFVYVPTEEELESGRVNMPIDNSRIYKMVSASGSQCFFVPYFIASPIVPTTELGANNKSERSWDNIMIKSVCIPITIDRLGQLTNASTLIR